LAPDRVRIVIVADVARGWEAGIKVIRALDLARLAGEGTLKVFVTKPFLVTGAAAPDIAGNSEQPENALRQ
jgi:hypothetical protein